MTFISKNNRVPLVLLALLMVGYFWGWAYLLRQGIIAEQWMYWRIGLLTGAIILLVVCYVARDETFHARAILAVLLLSWAVVLAGLVLCMFIQWHLPSSQTVPFTLILWFEAAALVIGFFIGEGRRE